jgi:hypothetical protein
MVDMARSLPPQHPAEVKHLHSGDECRSVFYRLFRQEFLQSLKLPSANPQPNGTDPDSQLASSTPPSSASIPPLSTDTLTGFSRGMADSAKHTRNLRRATKHLVEVVIPELAKSLDLGLFDCMSVFGSAGGIKGGASSKFSRPAQQSDIPGILHRHGVNIHHIGLLRSKVCA